MHKIWLGDIYEWAGEYRHVNVANGGYMFAAANRVPSVPRVASRKMLPA
jgi:cell filamentation protein